MKKQKIMKENKEIIPQCVDYLMIIKYLERMADHATNIAEDVIFAITGEDIRHSAKVEAVKNVLK